MLPPSMYAHIMNGLLVFAAVIVAYINFSVLKRLDPYKLVMIFLVFSIAIGIHGLSHMGLEAVYGFNPLK
jgi:tetrahydromethanopterin S-methyltransferase subunit E